MERGDFSPLYYIIFMNTFNNRFEHYHERKSKIAVNQMHLQEAENMAPAVREYLKSQIEDMERQNKELEKEFGGTIPNISYESLSK